MKFKKSTGFTLVELLIVIALIAILSVGVLATINPIEQKNKAVDASTSNDAGEVLNAYERYYTNQSNYPWMVVDTVNYPSADTVYHGVSNMAGSGLCTNAAAGTLAHTLCSAYNAPGALISSDELKDSFLEKNYGAVVGDGTTRYNLLNLLYVVKQGVANHNSIYVCYIPKAKANRTVTNHLKKLAIDANNLPTTLVDAAPADFDASGSPAAAWTFATPVLSLFKCVP
jgi:prepilin-type N-terminal cleavage/methylation domain-containing protein